MEATEEDMKLGYISEKYFQETILPRNLEVGGGPIKHTGWIHFIQMPRLCWNDFTTSYNFPKIFNGGLSA